MLELSGKWSSLMQDLVPAVVAGLHSTSRNYRHTECPVHGGRDGFRFFKDFHETGAVVCNTCGMKPNGIVTIAWYLGISTKEATKLAGEWLDGGKATVAPRVAPPPVDTKPKTYERELRAIKRVAAKSVPIEGTPVERYLRKVRKLPAYAVPYGTLRCAYDMKYMHEVAPEKWQHLGDFACLIASVRDCADKDAVRTLHRIYLAEDGNKAPVPDAKKSMNVVGTMNGAAVQLFRPDRILAITEGLETGLSVRAGTYLPVWATLTAGEMEHLNLPQDVELFIIFADKDRSERGFIAACKLAQRILAAGKAVIVYYPEDSIPEGSKGLDWADVWVNKGSAGFPEMWRYDRRSGHAAWMETLARTDMGCDPLWTLLPDNSQDLDLYNCDEAVKRQRAIAQEKRLKRQQELAEARALEAAT